MAKTGYLDIPPELYDLWNEVFQIGNGQINPHVKLKKWHFTRREKQRLRELSPLVRNALLWGLFDTTTKEAWSNAGFQSGLSGWQAFNIDHEGRYKAGVPGIATPSTEHQNFVGKINLNASNEEIKLIQRHPTHYYMLTRQFPDRSILIDQNITEIFGKPFTLRVNYFSRLEVAGADPIAKIYAIIYSRYQARDIETLVEIPLDLEADWTESAEAITDTFGRADRYDIYIHLKHVTGFIYFDNIKAEHDGQNWARDPYFYNMESVFPAIYKNAIPNWEVLTAGANTQWGTEYPIVEE